MRCERFYGNISYRLKDIGMKSKQSWLGYMFKFVIRATWVNKSCQSQRFIYSAHNGVSGRKDKLCSVVSGGEIYDYSAKTSNNVWKGTTEKKLFQICIDFLRSLVAFVKETKITLPCLPAVRPYHPQRCRKFCRNVWYLNLTDTNCCDI